jgi:hypothetical protein
VKRPWDWSQASPATVASESSSSSLKASPSNASRSWTHSEWLIHSCGCSRRSSTNPRASRSDFSKYCPLNLWTRWKGDFKWVYTQHKSQKMWGVKQSLHRWVPGVVLHTVQVRCEGGASCLIISIRSSFLSLQ